MRISEKQKNQYPLLVRVIFWAQKRKYGETLLPAKLWGRSPKLFYGLQAFYRSIDRQNSLIEPALRSLINVMVSQINHCSFCVDIGNALLLKRGADMDKVTAIADYEKNSIFTEKERVALNYAEAMTRTDRGVNNDTFRRLSEYFNDDEIIELTALIGYQNLASKFNAALDIPSQGFCISPLSSKTN